MTTSIRRIRIVLALLIVTFGYLALQASQREALIYDEGLAAYGAQEVMHGSIPYRDFWALYPPGQFYTLAGVFSLFGASLLVERLWSCLIQALLACVLFLLAEALAGPWLALLLSGTYVFIFGNSGFYGYAVFPALLWALTSCGCFFCFLQSPRRMEWLAASGICTALAVFYRHDLGFYAFAAQSLTLVGRHLPAFATESREPRLRKEAVVYAAAVFLPVGLLAALFLLHVSAGELFRDLIVIPSTVFRQVRFLPHPEFWTGFWRFGFLRWLRFWFPVLICSAGLAVSLQVLRRNSPDGTDRVQMWRVLLLSLLGIGFFAQSVIRADSIHQLPARMPAALLLAALGSRLLRTHKPVSRQLRAAASMLCLISLPLLLPRSIQRPLAWIERMGNHWPFACPSSLERAGCIPLAADQEKAIYYLRSLVPPDERIFVGNSRHDRIYINDVSFYFLAGRRSATKYHHLHPGVATTLPVQERIIRDLVQNGVRTIVLFSEESAPPEPNQSAVSSGVWALDDFIRNHFPQVTRFGRYAILRRKSQEPVHTNQILQGK